MEKEVWEMIKEAKTDEQKRIEKLDEERLEMEVYI